MKKLKINLREAKSKYLYKNNTFDWDDNYISFIKEYYPKNYGYNTDDRHNCIDRVKITDVEYSNIIELFESCNLDMKNQNKIKNAITSLCKENPFSIKKENKIQNQKQNYKIVEDYIIKEYGELLTFCISDNCIYYNNIKADTKRIQSICLDVKLNCPNVQDIKSIIYNVANRHKFKNKTVLSKNVSKSWNILDDIDINEWEKYLEYDDKGNIKHNIRNYAIFLRAHPQFKDKFKYNEFDKVEYMEKWDEYLKEYILVPVDDNLMNIIKSQIEAYFGSCTTSYVEPAFSVALDNNKYHEIKSIIYNCIEKGWDGKHRVREQFIKYFDAEDCEEVREMTEVMMCGALQRILEEKPNEGTAFDYMLVQFGVQGSGKTKYIIRLFFKQKYVIINPELNKEQDWVDKTNRAWCVLFDEMASIDKADLNTVKTRLTTQGNTCRLSYGRRSKYYPIHCVYYGNTNYIYIFRDEDYERRFLCMECPSTGHTTEWWNENLTEYDIEQIWAETFEIYKNKYKGKVITISDKTKEYNKRIQLRHKVAMGDTKTSLQIEDILNWNGWSKCFFDRDERYLFNSERLNHLMKNDKSIDGCKLKCIYCDWITTEFNRKPYWIDLIINKLGWKKIEVDGIEMYVTNELNDENDVKNVMKTATISALEPIF